MSSAADLPARDDRSEETAAHLDFIRQIVTESISLQKAYDEELAMGFDLRLIGYREHGFIKPCC